MSDGSNAPVSIETLQAINVAFAEAADGLRAALQSRQDDADRLTIELRQAKAELAMQRADGDAAAAAALERLHQAEQDTQALRRQLEQAEAALATAAEEKDGQRAALDTSAQEVARLCAERLAAEAARNRVETQLTALQSEYARQQERLRDSEAQCKLRDAQHGELGAELSMLREEEQKLRLALQEQARALMLATAAAAAEREAHTRQIGQIEQATGTLRRQTDARAAALRDELEHLRARLGATTAQLDELRKENQGLRETCTAQVMSERERAAHTAAESARHSEARRVEWMQMRAAWEQTLTHRAAELQKAQGRLRGAEERLRRLEWTADRLQTQVDEGRLRERGLLLQWQGLQAEAQALRRQPEAETVAEHVEASATTSPAPIPPPTPVLPEVVAPAAPPEAPKNTSAMTEPLPDIKHVNQLLALRDAAFVRAAYICLLGREPDPDGLSHFLDRVATYHDKVAVVIDLANSDEGRARGVRLAGLPELLAERRPRTGRVALWLQRLAIGLSGVRRIEAAVDSTAGELAARLGEFELRLSELAAQVAHTAEASRHEAAQLRERLDRDSAELGGTLVSCRDSLAGCEQALAALPGHMERRLSELLEAQQAAILLALPERIAPPAPPPPPPPPPPAAPSARALELDASQGATVLMKQLADALAASQEAAMLARPAPI